MRTDEQETNVELETSWKRFPQADQMFRQIVEDFCDDCQFADRLRVKMFAETGTRFADWVDHVIVCEHTQLNGRPFEAELLDFGYSLDSESTQLRRYVHKGGQFAPIYFWPDESRRLVLRVDSVAEFVSAHQLQGIELEGRSHSGFRKALISQDAKCEFWVCERQGYLDWEVDASRNELRIKALDHLERFQLRRRKFGDDQPGFAAVRDLIRQSNDDLGINWTCDLFFRAEREYWQRRNHAAQVQKRRQDKLGLGWANHDHHTYRSSRSRFAELIRIFELLGFECRERFYAGQEAGWGAQVLEQPACGIVIFADVDLTPVELAVDFAHQGLEPAAELGTVGLWCQLHGEAILQAGMHHLECTFDFDAARNQLDREGVESMAPFTDTPCLRQAFTTGETWPVDRQRVERAVEKGLISRQQAGKFIKEGAIGSHLEILERNEGFKGFNQTGVSEIIVKTDPRKITT